MKKILMAFALTLVASCGDFTDRNFIAGSNSGEASDSNELLGNLELINEGEFSLEKLLANSGTFVVGPTINKLKENSTLLSQSYTQYCLGLETRTSVTEENLEKLRKPVQENWKEMMKTYHRLVLMNYGPGKDETSTAMDSIYSFDGEEKCRLDQSIVNYSRNKRLPRLDTTTNYNVRGLDSIEPLIFGNPNISRCSKVHSVIANWFKKPLIEREKFACGYSIHLLTDIENKVDELYRAWSPNYQYFTNTMLTSKNNKSSIEWVNEISEVLFSLDLITKDVKLSYPAGLDVMKGGKKSQCGYDSCPNKVEHPYANFSFDAMIASLEGFHALFFGINLENGFNGIGFDDLLTERGFGKIATSIDRDSIELIKTLKKHSETTTFKEMLKGINRTDCDETTSENRKVEACALVWDMRKITNVLKVDYLNALQELSAPKQATGDND